MFKSHFHLPRPLKGCESLVICFCLALSILATKINEGNVSLICLLYSLALLSDRCNGATDTLERILWIP